MKLRRFHTGKTAKTTIEYARSDIHFVNMIH